jgi:hypothetical protein
MQHRTQHAMTTGAAAAARGLALVAALLLPGCSSSTAAKSTDNNLSNLTLSVGTLSPAFSAAVTSYGAVVPSTTTSITVTATASSSKATLQVNSVVVTSGSPSAAISLTAGFNLIQIAVYAEDGTVRIYQVTVTR